MLSSLVSLVLLSGCLGCAGICAILGSTYTGEYEVRSLQTCMLSPLHDLPRRVTCAAQRLPVGRVQPVCAGC